MMEKTTRRVKVFKFGAWNRENKAGDKIMVGIGEFVQYGVDYDEFQSGPGNFTTAIIEMPDGTVQNIPVALIQFIIE